jgi:tyrosine-specific transport protein
VARSARPSAPSRSTSRERALRLADLKPADATVTGAVALIMGSTIGAGILALPEVTAAAGFAPSAATLCGVWALLTAEALLLAEVNLAILARRPPSSAGDVVTLREMALISFGPAGSHCVSAAYLALSYTLSVAYISKASDLAFGFLGLDSAAGAALFTAVVGATLAAGARVVDGANRGATVALLALYAAIVASGASSAHWPELARADWAAAPAAIPVVLLSLVYHDLVPVVCAQLGGDAGKVRTALIAGSAAPLAMFLAWDGVALALGGGDGGDPLTALASSGGPLLSGAIAAFSMLALATSALGNSLGLSETVAAELRGLLRTAGADVAASTDGDDDDEVDAASTAATIPFAAAPVRAAALALVLAPPLFASVAHPGSFIAALNVAGGYGMTLLYGVLPPLMAWRTREAGREGAAAAVPSLLPGGRPLLGALTACAVAVEVGRLVEDLKPAQVVAAAADAAATTVASFADAAVLVAEAVDAVAVVGMALGDVLLGGAVVF